MSDQPTGTVTFLFTDLGSSTRLWDEHPEAMRAALARHDEILRTSVVAHGGHVVKMTGDGVHAVFEDPSAAVEAAAAGQRALAAEAWAFPEPLLVRMGIHTGPAELRAGDYYGGAVNRAARLMAIAHRGQVLASLATVELLRDELPTDVELLDLGEHRLRDLARPERIFQVAAPGLESSFPPLHAMDAFPSNLPAQVTSFVGRDDDVARIVGLLDEASLVTLTGTGGVGKTRLAVQAAAEAVARFADGAWFCELAAVDDGEAMAQVIAATLGCVQRPGLSVAESIIEYVKVRELLLVLDNCEHLLDDASELADAVVRSCPKVRVVATSREALDVTGERVVRVRSLSAPAATAGEDELLTSPAVRLFADRAADAGAEISWDERQWTAVGEICRRVDGIPLAIELAAARTAAMSPADVAAHLDERFRLLTGKRRGRVERHQTLRATVEWSYQLLDEDERAVFDRLGVFVGTFDAPAAIAVVAGDDHDAWAVTDALSSLVAKSMLVTENGPDGTTRYGMLETLRQFAREQLDGAGTTDHWRRAHADHYAVSAGEIGQGIAGPDDLLWGKRLWADLDNIRAAVSWALEREDPDEQRIALCILASIEESLRLDPMMNFGPLAVQALDAAATAAPELRAPVMNLAAYHEWNQGRTARAIELVNEALRDGIIETMTNPFAPYIGAVVFEMAGGHHTRALEIADEARAQLERVDSIYAQASLLAGVANFRAMAGLFEQAREDADRSLELARELGNTAMITAALYAVSWALHRADPAAGLAAAEECIDLYRRVDVNYGATSGVFSIAGGLRAQLGNDVGALELLQEAVIVARDQGVRPQLAAALDWALSPLFRLGRPEVAATFLGALRQGSLAGVGDFPGVAAARSRSLDRAREVLGDEAETHFARGAAMSNDELVAYAIRHLDPA